MSTDKTAAIAKHSEHVVKVQKIFTNLEDDALTKELQLPKSLSKTMYFFHRVKRKNYVSRVHNNVHIIQSDDMQSIVNKLRHELEVEEIILGLQRVQHHDAVKVGNVYGMIYKIRLQ